MRKLLILLLLMNVSVASANIPSNKEPTLNFVPYTPIENKIRKKDHQMCIRRARVSAAAFTNGKLHGATLESQLEQWDAFSLSVNAERIDVYELTKIRDLISLAFKAMEKYPHMTSLHFGDFVYASCLKEKLSILAAR